MRQLVAKFRINWHEGCIGIGNQTVVWSWFVQTSTVKHGFRVRVPRHTNFFRPGRTIFVALGAGMRIFGVLEIGASCRNGKEAQMSESHEVNPIVSFGDHMVDFDAVPRHVQIGFFARTFAHKLGNEVDAAIIARVKNELEDPKASKDAVAAWRDANPEKVAEWRKELRDRLTVKILDGTVGIRESNGTAKPKTDPVDDRFNQLVLAEMQPILAAYGYTKTKRPKMDDVFHDSFGHSISVRRLYDAIATQEGHQLFKGHALRERAEKDVAAGLRKAQKQATVNLADMGLAG